MNVQGVKYYGAPNALQNGKLCRGVRLRLEPEPDNPHDRNAVKILLADSNVQLGYVPRILAPYIFLQLDKGNQYECIVVDLPNDECLRISCKLNFRSPPSLVPPSSMLSESSGIYAIVNFANFKIYIGQSKKVGSRVREHLRKLQQKSHEHPALQDDWNQFGETCFWFTSIELVDEESLDNKETHYVGLWATYDPENGYNNTPLGRGPTPKPRPPRRPDDDVILPPPNPNEPVRMPVSSSSSLPGNIGCLLLLLGFIAMAIVMVSSILDFVF